MTWATKVRDGRHKASSIPLVETPLVLREEPTSWGAIEVIAWDQVHRCPKKSATDAPRPTRAHRSRVPAHRPLKASERGDHAYASFTPDRIAELKQRLEQAPAPKPPQQGRLR